MTAAVATSPQQVNIRPQDASAAEARKRRREILASQKVPSPDTVASLPSGPAEADQAKKRRVSNDEISSAKLDVTKATETSTKGKKSAMKKYDPDVPMSKEEVTVWRREQRRKRNRESAAASRQRQRDRIAELEVEVSEWKAKYDEIMEKLKTMEESVPKPVTSTATSSTPEQVIVSPPLSPREILRPLFDSSIVSESDSDTSRFSGTGFGSCAGELKQQPSNMISGQALSRIIHLRVGR